MPVYKKKGEIFLLNKRVVVVNIILVNLKNLC